MHCSLSANNFCHLSLKPIHNLALVNLYSINLTTEQINVNQFKRYQEKVEPTRPDLLTGGGDLLPRRTNGTSTANSHTRADTNQHSAGFNGYGDD